MDETDKYHVMLQAMMERRRQQEEEKKLKRETEEEWLKTEQKKRKHLREQWLSQTAPVLVFPSFDASRPRPASQDEADSRQHTAAAEQTKSQKTPEDEEAADARKEEQDSTEEHKESVNCTDAATTYDCCEAGTDEDLQENKAAEDHLSVQMAHRMFHDGSQDGRSVLGTLAVQVERDPKTGATVIRSVTPMSTSAEVPMATTIFDDGRKSIHAVGGAGGQPSTAELGQILSVIDGVGMKVLLDEVTVDKAEIKTENIDVSTEPEGKVLSFSTCHAKSEEENAQSATRSYDLEPELGMKDGSTSLGIEEDHKEDRNITLVGDLAGELCNVGDQSLEECPVTLVFLGYADSDTDQGHDQDDHQGMLTVERVIITDEGEEHVIGPVSPASLQAEKESHQVFQDIPIDGNEAAGLKVQAEEGDKEPHNETVPSTAEGGGTSKRKTCQCCSIM